jgi:hypothetical protein
MPRKPKITRLEPRARAHIERLLREDRLTLDEMLADIGKHFPAARVSRSAVHRYRQSVKQVGERMRAQDAAARAIVAELGESPDERAGALLVQTVTAMATDVVLRASENEELPVDDARALARMVKDTIDARSKSLKEREAIEKAAREKLVREQKEKLDALGKSGEVDPAVLARVIKAAYGL